MSYYVLVGDVVREVIWTLFTYGDAIREVIWTLFTYGDAIKEVHQVIFTTPTLNCTHYTQL
jgi:hypothetical protein